MWKQAANGHAEGTAYESNDRQDSPILAEAFESHIWEPIEPDRTHSQQKGVKEESHT